MKIKQIIFTACCAASALSAGAQGTGGFSWSNLPTAKMPTFKTDTLTITKYGAKPDGISLNTEAINAAINACSNKGGGVVVIPQGLWLTGPIVLKSNVNLHVDRAALVLFTTDKSQYKLVVGSYEGHDAPCNQSPISGTDLENIAITGEGVFDGNGGVWRAIGKDRLTNEEWQTLVNSGGVVSDDGKSWLPSAGYQAANKIKDVRVLKPGKTLDDYAAYKDFFRPNMLVLTNCKKVWLQGITVQNSPDWCIHTLLCEDMTLQGVHVRNPWNAQNGDGIDMESCRNVLLEGSTFDAGDDGICVKSGRDEDGRKRGKPTENVVVRNNVVYRAHGGFVIGSEMSGGARNIFVSDCTFIGTDIGLRFKTVRGRGGVVENIYIKNISMRNILHEAILFDMYYQTKAASTLGQNMVIPPVDEGTPQFRNFYVSNVVCNGAEKAIFLRGLPEMAITGMHLENMVFKTNKGIELIEAKNISLKNISLQITDPTQLAYIENSSAIVLDGVKSLSAVDLYLSVNGDRSKQIQLIGPDFSNAKNKTAFGYGADKSAVLDIK